MSMVHWRLTGLYGGGQSMGSILCDPRIEPTLWAGRVWQELRSYGVRPCLRMSSSSSGLPCTVDFGLQSAGCAMSCNRMHHVRCAINWMRLQTTSYAHASSLGRYGTACSFRWGFRRWRLARTTPRSTGGCVPGTPSRKPFGGALIR
jgi:hypothetical protein